MIQTRRKEIWEQYYEGLKPLADKGYFKLPNIPEYATNNAHMFYIVCRSLKERTALIKYLKENEILSVFHYLSLHKSGFYTNHSDFRPDNYQSLESVKVQNFDGTVSDEVQVVGLDLPNCDHFADCLLRLPMYYELKDEDVIGIITHIKDFYKI